MDCSLLGSSVHGIFRARVLERVAIAFSEWRLEVHYLKKIYFQSDMFKKTESINIFPILFIIPFTNLKLNKVNYMWFRMAWASPLQWYSGFPLSLERLSTRHCQLKSCPLAQTQKCHPGSLPWFQWLETFSLSLSGNFFDLSLWFCWNFY